MLEVRNVYLQNELGETGAGIAAGDVHTHTQGAAPSSQALRAWRSRLTMTDSGHCPLPYPHKFQEASGFASKREWVCAAVQHDLAPWSKLFEPRLSMHST